MDTVHCRDYNVITGVLSWLMTYLLRKLPTHFWVLTPPQSRSPWFISALHPPNRSISYAFCGRETLIVPLKLHDFKHFTAPNHIAVVMVHEIKYEKTHRSHEHSQYIFTTSHLNPLVADIFPVSSSIKMRISESSWYNPTQLND